MDFQKIEVVEDQPALNCSNCISDFSNKIENTIGLIKNHYESANSPWVLGFSGGKDSSALVKLTLEAVSRAKNSSLPLTVLYCDTGVEIPLISENVSRELKQIELYAKKQSLNIEVKRVVPPLENTYFVKVIGRGYPPPTNKFRWCTDKLRILPVQTYLTTDGLKTVLLGTRYGESHERNKVLDKNRKDEKYYFNQSGYSNTQIFAPLIDYSTEEIWAALNYEGCPNIINTDKLTTLYKDAGSECPIIRSEDDSPCSKGRFGCWTCTVIRQDKAVTSLVASGHDDHNPLLNFRNWLQLIRDEKKYRCSRRRNGARSLGPFRMSARKEILDKLLTAEKESGISLITTQEIKKIKQLWKEDLENPKYIED